MLAEKTGVPVPKRAKGRIAGFWPKLRGIQTSLMRHLLAQNTRPYEQILQHVRTRPDVWIASQGEYIAWWQQREEASLTITVSDGVCQIQTSLENGVIESYPGRFLETPLLPCPEADFSGEVWLTIDSALEKKELLTELLKREGILNFRVAETGEFMLSQADVGALLADVETKLRQRDVLQEADIAALRQIIIDKFAARGLPLLRLWYHPRINGIVTQVVFSARYDVDRAITNVPHIRALEMRYDAPSTLYIRIFCPFYTAQQIEELVSQPWCSEIALHGEFVTNARTFGDEFEAARAEKLRLEKLAGRPVLGVGMHGGELTYNRSEHTSTAIQKADFLYDTTPTYFYYFPYRRYVNGQLSQTYTLCHAVTDVRIPANRHYGQLFYEQTIAKLNKIYEQNGVFIIVMHPIYFGLGAYLARPGNLYRLVKFLLSYFVK